jgi:hypothetical protein
MLRCPRVLITPIRVWVLYWRFADYPVWRIQLFCGWSFPCCGYLAVFPMQKERYRTTLISILIFRLFGGVNYIMNRAYRPMIIPELILWLSLRFCFLVSLNNTRLGYFVPLNFFCLWVKAIKFKNSWTWKTLRKVQVENECVTKLRDRDPVFTPRWMTTVTLKSASRLSCCCWSQNCCFGYSRLTLHIPRRRWISSRKAQQRP